MRATRFYMSTEKRVIYYRDELNDEFSSAVITPRKIDGSYRYLRDGYMGRFIHFILYRIIAAPLAKAWLRLYFGHRIIGDKPGRREKGAFYIYGNHTHFMADALMPTMVGSPRDIYVIVNPENVSMPVLGRMTPYMGALPLPADTESTGNFLRAVRKLESRGYGIAIYPEAHIWPYYTDIRPFTEKSFRYPAQSDLPVYCFTDTYQKRRFRKTPRLVTYIDGPFRADETLKVKDKQKVLRDAVYNAMKQRSENSDIEMIRYVKSTEADGEA